MDRKYVIAIDSGHGIDTIGKESPDGSLREWEFNKDIELRLTYLLEKERIPYFLIHPDNQDTPLKQRKNNISKFLSVNNESIIIGISIHADAWEKESANGFTVFYRAKNTTEDSRSLASYRLASTLEVVIKEFYNKEGIQIKSRGVKASPTAGEVPSYFVLREYIGTWVLLESGFMTNNSDCSYLKSGYFRNTLAGAIFESIKRYCQI